MVELFRLDGEVAVVTGGGRGIGRAVATAFAEAGAKVVIAEREASLGARAAGELGGDAEFIELDVSDSAAVRCAADEIVRRHGCVDVLVNNAGICLNADALSTTDEIWRRQMAVNLDGLFYCCREFGGHMVRRGGGSVVNLSSMAAFINARPQKHVGYSATKAAVAQVTRALASEWAKSGVRVNAIAPGYVGTEMPLAAGRELVDQWLEQIPIGRLLEPAEIAAAILFLASRASSALTGSVIIADGGYTSW